MNDQTVLAWGQPQASLQIRYGAHVGTTFSIVRSEVILGREEGIDITIRDPEVSRRHARISWQSGDYYIEDLGSTNGTFLNGTLVTRPQALRSGDMISVGQSTLIFEAQTSEAPAQTAGVAGSPAAPPPPPAAAPTEQKRGGTRCLLWGCGCLALLGVVLLAMMVVLLLTVPQMVEDVVNGVLNLLGLRVDLVTTLYLIPPLK